MIDVTYNCWVYNIDVIYYIFGCLFLQIPKAINVKYAKD